MNQQLHPFSVVFVLDSFSNPNAGTESQFLKLAKGLQACGFELQIATLRHSPVLARELPTAHVTDLGSGRIASPLSWARLLRFLRQKKRAGARLVHVFFNDASLMVPPLARLVGLKTIISRRDMGFWYTPTLRRLLRLTGRTVDAVVANAKAVGAITAQVELIPTNRIHVIANGYQDIGDISPVNVAVLEGVAVEAIQGARLGIVANLRPIKRIADAIEALGRVQSDFPGTHLLVVGSGDPAPLKTLSRQLDVERQVIFAGGQKHPEQWIDTFDIALMCSESEGFSNAIIEYLQMGKPVVCTDTGGNPEAIQHGDNGFLYPVADIGALESCLRLLLDDPALRQRMGQRAKDGVREHFSLARMIDAHLDLYAALVTES